MGGVILGVCCNSPVQLMLLLVPLICISSHGSSDIAEGFAKGNPYLGVTRVSSSEGCRMRQVVKVKVELVCDMHFPG